MDQNKQVIGLLGALGVAIGAAWALRPKKGKKGTDPQEAFTERFEIEPPEPAPPPAPPPALKALTFVVQDNFAVADRVTGFAHKKWTETHAPEKLSSPPVTKCLNSGAKLVGTTNMSELGYSFDGACSGLANPAGAALGVGGGAAGAAVAVAGGEADFALAVDTRGEARCPAANTGLFAHRATAGKIAARGVVGCAEAYDTVSILAREAAVLRKAAGVLMGLDLSAGQGGLRRPLKVLMVDDAVERCPDGSMRKALAHVLVATQGHPAAPVVDHVSLGGFLEKKMPILSTAGLAPKEAEGKDGLEKLCSALKSHAQQQWWAAHGPWLESARVSAPGKAPSADSAWPLEDPGVWQQWTAQLKAAVKELLKSKTVLCLPTVPGAAPARDAPPSPEATEAQDLLLALASAAGLPQVSVPVRVPGGSGPLGVSLVGAPGDDHLLLDYAVQLAPLLAKSVKDGLDDTAKAAPLTAAEAASKAAVVDQQKEKGNAAFKAGRYEEAVKHYSAAIARDPTIATLYSNRAMALLKIGDFAKADEDCSAALAMNPANVKALLRRGTSRAFLGMYTEALTDFEAVLKLEPKNKEASNEINRMRKLVDVA